jgi:hypothetical protein
MNLEEKTKYANETILAHITYAHTPEYLVAKSLQRKGITESDFFNMRFKLNISNAKLITISNHLRDLWRNPNDGT